jgi:hypothetical protein
LKLVFQEVLCTWKSLSHSILINESKVMYFLFVGTCEFPPLK